MAHLASATDQGSANASAATMSHSPADIRPASAGAWVRRPDRARAQAVFRRRHEVRQIAGAPHAQGGHPADRFKMAADHRQRRRDGTRRDEVILQPCMHQPVRVGADHPRDLPGVSRKIHSGRIGHACGLQTSFARSVILQFACRTSGTTKIVATAMRLQLITLRPGRL